MNLRAWIEFYRAVFLVEMGIKIQYRVHTFIWLVGLLIEPIIYLAVWSKVAEAQGGAVGGYTATDFAAYYVVLLVVRQMVVAPSPHRIAFSIQRGDMSAFLLRPVNIIFYDLGESNCQKLVSLPFLAVITVFIGLVFNANVPLDVELALLFVPAVLMAGMVRFMVQYTLGIIGFWTTKIDGIWLTYVAIQTVLGGLLSPLSFLPAPLAQAAEWMPFRWVFSFPVQLMLGQLDAAAILEGFAMQTLWISLCAVLFYYGWGIGVRRYGAVGG